MELKIVLLVLVSAAIHPVWNLIVKKNSDPQLGFLCLAATMSVCALIHGMLAGDDFAAVLTVLPLIGLSVCGLLLYGVCLTATLKRGDLSSYYPIVRASPVFIVLVSVMFLGVSYPPVILLGISMAVIGGSLLLYQPGTRILGNPRTLGLALLAMAGTGIYSIADARLMQTISPQVQIFVVDGLLVPVYATMRYWRYATTKSPPKIDWREQSLVYLLLPGVLAYASYYLILFAYQLGADVAAVTSVRQASIPISVMLGGMFLSEGSVIQRLVAAIILALGIVVIALFG